ncbi:hypothetical protein C8Q76DRAFT_210011 [Earliella scabrosa]|nr:hypothetical protein C8Q76DRAFT_210011 [Earliella scabrosa]
MFLFSSLLSVCTQTDAETHVDGPTPADGHQSTLAHTTRPRPAYAYVIDRDAPSARCTSSVQAPAPPSVPPREYGLLIVGLCWPDFAFSARMYNYAVLIGSWLLGGLDMVAVRRLRKVLGVLMDLRLEDHIDRPGWCWQPQSRCGNRCLTGCLSKWIVNGHHVQPLDTTWLHTRTLCEPRRLHRESWLQYLSSIVQ